MITISKTEFETYVPVAKEPADSTEVFNLLQHGMLAAWLEVKNDILGHAVATQVENGTATADIIRDVKALVCMKAFANAVRRNDLIMTPTGFGVVSTDKVAPASRERVNAMLAELWQHIYDTYDSLVSNLLGVQAWYEDTVSSLVVATVFYKIGDYKRYASSEQERYYISTDPAVRAANHFLVQHISSAYNTVLLTAIRQNAVTAEMRPVIGAMRRFIGAELTHNKYASRAAYEDLISILDGDLTTYSVYAHSDAYRLNHYSHYANAADDPCFFFG